MLFPSFPNSCVLFFTMQTRLLILWRSCWPWDIPTKGVGFLSSWKSRMETLGKAWTFCILNSSVNNRNQRKNAVFLSNFCFNLLNHLYSLLVERMMYNSSLHRKLNCFCVFYSTFLKLSSTVFYFNIDILMLVTRTLFSQGWNNTKCNEFR